MLNEDKRKAVEIIVEQRAEARDPETRTAISRSSHARTDMIPDALLKPWPWYVTGPLIGLFAPLLLVVGNRLFGVSSNLRHMCAPFASGIAYSATTGGAWVAGTWHSRSAS